MLEVGTGFNTEMTGRENVYLNSAILGMTRAEIDAKMEQIIAFSEVRDFIDTPVKRYSSGMYVKLAFSVAAHLDSEIMIMDEVLAVGDMAFQKKCLGKMREAAKKEGRTVLYVSHNMNTIRQLCDRCIVLDKGKVIFDGDVEQAISIYYGTNGDALLPLTYNLKELSRPSQQHGNDIRITEFKFLAEEQAVFRRTEGVSFQLTLEANKHVEGLKLLFPVRTTNDITVGMTQTYAAITDTDPGKRYTCRFHFNCENLTEDTYCFTPDLFSDDGNGKHWSVDHPYCNIIFRLVEDAPIGLDWQQRYYGSVRLNGLSVVDVVEQE